MKEKDIIQRFVFEHFAVRGELVSLGATWRAVLDGQTYPKAVRRQLGELVVATALLASTLKYEGRLTAQVESSGPLSLLVVQCTNTLAMRGVARFDELGTANSFDELYGEGRVIITIDTRGRAQPYQGIVPLVGNSLSESLENYFNSSIQLAARLWLRSDSSSASGMLLQCLPATKDKPMDQEAWRRVQFLADIIRDQEFSELSNQDLLRRLFHEEVVRIFEPKPVSFRCSCSGDAMGNVLQLLGADDVEQLLSEQGFVEVCCEFCNRKRRFDSIDVRALMQASILPLPSQRH